MLFNDRTDALTLTNATGQSHDINGGSGVTIEGGATVEIFYENNEYRVTWSPTTDVDDRLDTAESDITAIETNIDEVEADIDDLQYPTVEAQTGSFSVSPSNNKTTYRFSGTNTDSRTLTFTDTFTSGDAGFSINLINDSDLNLNMVTFGSQQINGHDSRNLTSNSVTVVHFDGANFYAQDDSYIIETNSGDIATNMASIVALTTAEQTNSTNIATNTTSITTNTTNIATNTTDIDNLEDRAEDLENYPVIQVTTGSRTVTQADEGHLFRFATLTNQTCTLPDLPLSSARGWHIYVANIIVSSGNGPQPRDLTLQTAGFQVINGKNTFVIKGGEAAQVIYTGAEFFTINTHPDTRLDVIEADIAEIQDDIDTLELDLLPNAIVRTSTALTLDIGSSHNRDYYIARTGNAGNKTWDLPTDPGNGWSVTIENQLSNNETLTINPTHSGTPDSDDPKFYADLGSSMDTVTIERSQILKFIYDTSASDDRWIVVDYDYDLIQRLRFPNVTTLANNNDNIGLDNNGDYIYVSNTAVNDIQIDDFSSAESGWHCWIINDTGELLRVATDGTETINGGNTLFLAPGDNTELIYDGSNFYSTARNTINDVTSGDSRGIGARHQGSRQIIDNSDIDKQVLLPDPDTIFDGWSVVIQNANDNWIYVRRHGDDTTSEIQRNNLNKGLSTNSLIREREIAEFTYESHDDTFYRHALNPGVIPFFHAEKTNTNIDLSLTGPLTGTVVDLVSGDIVTNQGGFTLNSGNYAVLRTNSRSSENRLFRVTVHAQFSKQATFSESGEVLISGLLRKNTDYLTETQTHSYWHSDDDALVAIELSAFIELEDEDELRPSFTTNPAVDNATVDYFDWTIVEVT